MAGSKNKDDQPDLGDLLRMFDGILGSKKGRSRGGWSKAAVAYVARVKEIINGLADYWPLTLRQVYYQLVAAGDIENNRNQYQKLSRMLTKARLDGVVPWEALEDRSRAFLPSGGYADALSFVQAELEDFLAGYRRDLLQTQNTALEIWIEKDALSRVCHGVAFRYCVSVVAAKGFSSVSYLHECRNRIMANAEDGRPTRILYFGDLDPSGWCMLPAMLETLQQEMGLSNTLSAERCALTPEQAVDWDLPYSIDAMKDTDTRTPKYKAMLRAEGYSDNLAVELDALPPATLEQLVEDAICRNLDQSELETQRDLERADRDRIAPLRRRGLRAVEGELADWG